MTSAKPSWTGLTQFKYLRCMINKGWDPDLEIRRRMKQDRITSLTFENFLQTRTWIYRMVKCYVLSVFLYGIETWTLKVPIINKIEAFEMLIIRRMLRVSWVTTREMMSCRTRAFRNYQEKKNRLSRTHTVQKPLWTLHSSKLKEGDGE